MVHGDQEVVSEYVVEHLLQALETPTGAEKDVQIRRALQYLVFMTEATGES
ncbi:MAG: hypothetical protein ABEJ06_02055 [Haloarculaceae archaeon]